MAYGYGEYEDPNYDPYNPYPSPVASGPVGPAPGEEVPGNVPPPPTTPPGPTAPADPWSVAPADGNWEGWFRTNLGRNTLTPEELKALGPSLSKVGVQVVQNASGVYGKIRLPNGQVVDVINRAGAGGNGFQWLTGDGGSSGGGVDINQASIDPSYLAPWEGAAPSPGSIPEFQSPGEFVAPTGDSILQDPSYRFRESEGRHALENSAAARGVLNSGGTLQDILKYGQGAASQEWGSIYDRMFGKWNADWNNALTTFRANKDVNDDVYGRAWQRYADAKDTWYANQDKPFDKLYKAASLGAGASA